MPLLGIYLKDQTPYYKDTCIFMFIFASLFTIARKTNNHKQPSTKECTSVWYIYTIEYYSGVKENKMKSTGFRRNYTELESQKAQKDKFYISMFRF